ncbi:hypothetical protein GIB67_005448 [Kingdonia uniflora]|uniref:Uncharacterized protein n=1 Tax=Kingdonia uniflora TaxID=39325 RepID=A0A7J7NHB9_9MAGN|nr:hypothetical protein GIB67_005448 [Kingdonia uniflora]
MQAGTCITIKDLDSIRVLVDQLEVEIESLMRNANFSLGEGKGRVKFGIEEIKKKVGVFMKNIEDLSEHADGCSRDIRRARTVVIQRIIKHPNTNT